MTDAINIKNLDFAYSKSPVLRGLDLRVKRGDLVLILGGNGSGKSTLIKLILGELRKDAGFIKVLGKDIEAYKSYKDIGYVPQMNVATKIAFPVTCLELVVLNLYEDFSLIKIPGRDHYKKARDILIKMGMEEYINTPVNELSGGLAQRAMICKAMVNEPSLLILDEPTAGVDKESKARFFESLRMLSEKFSITIVMVTHELKEMESFDMDLISYEMKDGRLVRC